MFLGKGTARHRQKRTPVTTTELQRVDRGPAHSALWLSVLMLFIAAQPAGIGFAITQPRTVEVPNCGADFVLMLDRTGSMSASALAAERIAAKNFLNLLGAASSPPRVGIGAFGDQQNGGVEAFIIRSMTNQYGDDDGAQDGDLYAAIDLATASNSSVGTNLADAISVGQNELANGTSPTRILILISDGDPNEPGPDPKNAALNASDAAKLAGKEIYTIHYGNDPAGFAGHELLAAIATGNVIPPPPYNSHKPGSADDQASAAAENSDGDHFLIAPTAADIQGVLETIILECPTLTPTPSATITATHTATATPTLTNTPTITPTTTPTRTSTNTPTPTPDCAGKPDGFPCTDSLFCNGPDTCKNGQCTQHAGDPCPSGPECNNNTCDEVNDNCFVPAGTACTPDDLVCTLDICDGAGACSHPVGDLAKCPRGYSILRWPEPAAPSVTAILGHESETAGRVCSDNVAFRNYAEQYSDTMALSDARYALRFKHLNVVTGTAATGGGEVRHPEVATVGILDSTGTSPLLADCRIASGLVATRRAVLTALPATQTFSAPVVVPARGVTTITVGAGTEVIDVPSITVKKRGTLLIQGVPGSTERVIVRVHGVLWLKYRSNISLADLDPDQVIFVTDGAVKVAAYSTINGSVTAASYVKLGRWAVLNGQAIGQQIGGLGIKVGAFVRINPHGWLGW